MSRTVRQLHDEAMRLSQEALVARVRGDAESQYDFAQRALLHEVMAAEKVPYAESSEPTRSILYRSAASLAFQIQDYPYALRLIGEGLRGFPPDDVTDELTSLWASIQRAKYLEESNLVAIDSGVSIRIAGPAVGQAQIPYAELDKRIEAITLLTDRVTDFLQNKPFTRTRPSSNALGLAPTLSNIRPGSFIADINFQAKAHQLNFFVELSDIISMVVDSIQQSDLGDKDGLIALFNGNQDYAANANYAVKQLAPDGSGVKEVNVSSRGKSVTIDTPSDYIEVLKPTTIMDSNVSQVFTAVGSINQPDRTRDTISFVPRDGSKPVTGIFVHDALADFIPRYWPEVVEITYEVVGKRKELLDIRMSLK